VLFFTLAISVLTGLVFGIIPALKASNTDLNEVLKAGGRGGTMGWTHNRMRSLLVVSEIALALVALIGAGLFLRSMQKAQEINPGFESKNLFQYNFDLGALRYDQDHGQQFFRDALDRVKTVPGVADATISGNGVIGGGISGTIFREGEQTDPNNRGTLVSFDDVMPGYFSALRIPTISGHDFTDFDRENTKRVVVINKAMADLVWPGRMLSAEIYYRCRPQSYEVVGVVGTTIVGAVGKTSARCLLPGAAAVFSLCLAHRTHHRQSRGAYGCRPRSGEPARPQPRLTNGQTIGQLLAQGLWAARMALLFSACSVCSLSSLPLSAFTGSVLLRHAAHQRNRHPHGSRRTIATSADLSSGRVCSGRRRRSRRRGHRASHHAFRLNFTLWRQPLRPAHVYRHRGSADGRRLLGMLHPARRATRIDRSTPALGNNHPQNAKLRGPNAEPRRRKLPEERGPPVVL
jgi:hypothetical protein